MSLLIKKCWSAQCLIIPVTFVAHTPAWNGFPLWSHIAVFADRFSVGLCIFRVTWLFHVTVENCPEKWKPPYRATQQPRRHKPPLSSSDSPSPSLLLNAQPSLKAKLKSFLLQEAFLDPLPTRLTPSLPYTSQSLCTFIILALTYLSLSYINIILCICLSHVTLSF